MICGVVIDEINVNIFELLDVGVEVVLLNCGENNGVIIINLLGGDFVSVIEWFDSEGNFIVEGV